MLVNEIPAIFTNVCSTRHNLDEIGAVPFREELIYRNYSNEILVITKRSGYRVVIHPEYPSNRAGLFITLGSYGDARVKENTEHLFSVLRENDFGDALRHMQESFDKRPRGLNAATGVVMMVEHFISIAEIRNKGGLIYHHELDIVISLMSKDKILIHPYSEVALGRNIIAATPAFQKDGASGCYYIIVDNHNAYGPRFYNINNEVRKITPKQDRTRKDGVYRVSSKPVRNNSDIVEEVMEYATFDKADETFGLYRTVEEARCLGDLNTAQKLRLAERDYENNVSKADFQAMKMAHEKIVLEHEKEKQIRDKEFSDLKHEREKDKHDRDKERDEREEAFLKLKHDHELLMARHEEDMLKAKHASEIHENEMLKNAREMQRLKDRTERLKLAGAVVAAVVTLATSTFGFVRFIQSIRVPKT